MLHRNKLENGLDVITVPVKGTEAVCVVIFVKVGSRHEVRRTNGIAHFVEHLMFKGTKRRPKTEMIARELDGVGAEYNAFTTKDHTGYYIKLPREHLALACDILSDMLTGSLLKQEEIDRERGVIFEEIKMYEENPLMHIGDLAEEVMFGDTPLGWRIAGTHDSVKRIKRNDIVKFVTQAYSPSSMVLAVAGAYGKTELKKLIGKWFATMPVGEGKLQKFLAYRSLPSHRPLVQIDHRDTAQVHLALSMRGLAYRDPAIEAAQLLAVIMGGNMSSRLFLEVRERRGLAYYVRADHTAYHDTGTWAVRCGVDQNKAHEALRVVLAEMTKVAKKGVTSEELKRAKEFLRGKITLELEDSAEVAEWYGRQAALIGEVKTPHEKLDKIMAVRAQDVRVMAQAIFRPSLLRLAIIGPYDDKKPFLKALANA